MEGMLAPGRTPFRAFPFAQKPAAARLQKKGPHFMSGLFARLKEGLGFSNKDRPATPAPPAPARNPAPVASPANSSPSTRGSQSEGTSITKSIKERLEENSSKAGPWNCSLCLTDLGKFNFNEVHSLFNTCPTCTKEMLADLASAARNKKEE